MKQIQLLNPFSATMIHRRMHPGHVRCLSAVCTLARSGWASGGIPYDLKSCFMGDFSLWDREAFIRIGGYVETSQNLHVETAHRLYVQQWASSPIKFWQFADQPTCHQAHERRGRPHQTQAVPAKKINPVVPVKASVPRKAATVKQASIPRKVAPMKKSVVKPKKAAVPSIKKISAVAPPINPNPATATAFVS